MIASRILNRNQRKHWGLGNYRTTAADIPPVSTHLLRLVQIQPGDSVLDVACRYGNTAITARRKGAKVTGIDLTPRMLAQAKEEEILAEVNGIEWREGDVEGLPFEDGPFDIVLSSFGHMFACSQSRYCFERDD
jgi:2-polyprenyl-3-methyl-5-hydroxy-6-metoxy-1,4-benzoquinol methylase